MNIKQPNLNEWFESSWYKFPVNTSSKEKLEFVKAERASLYDKHQWGIETCKLRELTCGIDKSIHIVRHTLTTFDGFDETTKYQLLRAAVQSVTGKYCNLESSSILLAYPDRFREIMTAIPIHKSLSGISTEPGFPIYNRIGRILELEAKDEDNSIYPDILLLATVFAMEYVIGEPIIPYMKSVVNSLIRLIKLAIDTEKQHIIIITQGVTMACLVKVLIGLTPYDFWITLGEPAFLELDANKMSIVKFDPGIPVVH